MKKILKIILIQLLVLIQLMLFSCNSEVIGTVDTDSSDDSENVSVSIDPVCTRGDMQGVFFGDIYYYRTRHDELRYYDLTDIESGSYSVSADTLSEYGVQGDFLAVSPELTAKNSGNPVLVILENCGSDFGRLFTYNTGNNKTTIIKDEVDPYVQSLHLYGETVIYTTNNGKEGYDLHVIDINGDNYIKKENNRKCQYSVSTVHEDRIYYADRRTGMLYSNSLMFDDEQSLFSCNTMQITPFIVDDYIYYADAAVKKVKFESMTFMSYTLCRRPLDDLTKEEVFMENLSSAVRRGDKLFFDYTEPRYVTETVLDYSSPLYEYSFETGETRQIFDLSGTLKDRVWTVVGEDHIVFTEIDYSTGLTFQTRTDTTMIHDLATGEEWQIPNYNDEE